MANSYIELPVQSGGQKIDSDQLTVASETVERQRSQIAGDAAAAIANVIATVPTTSDYGLMTRRALNRSAVQTFHSAQVLNATQTQDGSTAFDCSPYRKGRIYLTLTKVNDPTIFTIVPIYSDDGGTDWFEARDDEVNVTDMAEVGSTLKISFPVNVLGRSIKLRIKGDTDASNTFTATVTGEFYG
jgi:hypothetical protein